MVKPTIEVTFAARRPVSRHTGVTMTTEAPLGAEPERIRAQEYSLDEQEIERAVRWLDQLPGRVATRVVTLPIRAAGVTLTVAPR